MRKIFVAASILSIATHAGVAHPPPAPVQWPSKPPLAAVRPVTETIFNTPLTDPYRYMETPGDAETLAWMRAQAEHTRAVLDAIPERAGYLERLRSLGGSFGIVRSYTEAAGHAFYLERPAGGEVFNLMVRELGGETRALVDIATLDTRTGMPHAISYYAPSPDGTRVAVGVSQNGNENADLTVLDVETGAQLAGPVANARFAVPSFTPTGGLAFTVLQALRPDQPKTETFLNARAMLWDLRGEPVAIAGAPVVSGPRIRPDEMPYTYFAPGSLFAVMRVKEGVRNEVDLYVAPVAAAAHPGAQWRKVADRTEGVTDFSLRGDTLFLLSNNSAPTFRVLAMPISGSVATATEIIPARPERVLELIAAASDATYVGAREGVYSKLLRVPADGGTTEEIELPERGAIQKITADPREPGAVLLVTGWTAPPTLYRYEPTAQRFAELPSCTRPKLDFHATKRATCAPAPSMGSRCHCLSSRPRAKSTTTAAAERLRFVRPLPAAKLFAIAAGADRCGRDRRSVPRARRRRARRGVAARRQGREQAIHLARSHRLRRVSHRARVDHARSARDRWRLGGRYHRRPRNDRAARAVRRGHFKVPMASALRAEFQQNGPVNTVEFGTIRDPQGFRNLLAMDAYFTIEDARVYPARHVHDWPQRHAR